MSVRSQTVRHQRRGPAALGIFLLGLALSAAALSAHDLWIEPTSFRPRPGERVPVRLRVGDHFPGDPVPRWPQRIERFAAVPGVPEIAAEGEAPLPGVPDADPAGVLAAGAPGLWAIVYDSDHASITLAGDTFEHHLAEQGLERVSELRRQRGQSAAPATEIYSRCAKALVAVGGKADAGHDRLVGLPLELVPERSPAALAPGEELPVRLLYAGRPLAGARVEARNPRAPGETVAGRTDTDGRVKLRLASPGFWLVKAVHMVPAPPESGADWESFWASLTFEAGAAPPPGAGSLEADGVSRLAAGGVDAWAVTVEPQGGVPQPTGEMVLEG